MARSQGSEGDPQIWQRVPQARRHGLEEEGDLAPSSACKPHRGRGLRGPFQSGSAIPQHTSRDKGRRDTPPPGLQRTNHARKQGREGDTPTRQSATPSRNQREEEGWNPPQTAACAP